MKKFLTSLDKICHILMCVLITIISATILSKTTTDISVTVSALCGMFCAGVCGVLKEVIDFLRGGLFDTEDLIADGIGMVIGFLLVLFVLG